MHFFDLSLPLIRQVLVFRLQLEAVLQSSFDKFPSLLCYLMIREARHLICEWDLVIPGNHFILLVLVGIDVLVLLRELFLLFLTVQLGFRHPF